GEELLEVIYGVGSVVEDGGGQRSVGILQDVKKILGFAGATRRNHGDVGGLPHRARERTIETCLDAIGIHGGEQNFASTQFFATAGPFDCINTFVIAAGPRVDVPASATSAAGIDGQHDSLRAEFFTQFCDQFRTAN